MTKKNSDGTPVTCGRCGYSWNTKSEMYYVPCPRCHTQKRMKELPKITHA